MVPSYFLVEFKEINRIPAAPYQPSPWPERSLGAGISGGPACRNAPFSSLSGSLGILGAGLSEVKLRTSRGIRQCQYLPAGIARVSASDVFCLLPQLLSSLDPSWQIQECLRTNLFPDLDSPLRCLGNYFYGSLWIPVLGCHLSSGICLCCQSWGPGVEPKKRVGRCNNISRH